VLQHPVYATWAPVWRKLVHVYDGSGGFLNGTYLVAHPREWKDHTAESPRLPTKKLTARRQLARYENVAGLILDQIRAALFREQPTRTVGQSDKASAHPLEDWWEDVDGEGCTIDDWMSDAFVWSGLFGHVFHYMDREVVSMQLPGERSGPPQTAADAGRLFLRLYTPIDVPDWLQNARGKLTTVKLLESKDRESIDDAATLSEGSYMERVVTQETWTLREVNGRNKQTIEQDGPHPHRFGTIPVVVQYAKRRGLAPLIGQPILGDPNLYIDLYNLTSEIRELLRNQTFGILNVPLGTNADRVGVEEARLMMGDEKGSENVMFTPAPAQYVQPESTNVTVYQEERKELLRTIYRLAGIPWEADSKDAEAEGSLKLKREDMSQLLSRYADECEKAEYEIAKLWFRAEHGDSWEKAWENAEVVIRYPDSFDVTPFVEMLEQAQAAITLEMGPKVMGEIKMRLVPKFLPDAPPDLMAQLEQECMEAAEASADLQMQQKEAEIQMTKAKAVPKPGV
jgi:hypothetical protein